MRQMILVALVAAAAVSCDRPREITFPGKSAGAHVSMQRTEISPAAQLGVAQLRAVTARFHDLAAADDAGWNTRITSCFSSPEGGMGYHYGNTALIDGIVDAANPELLLYEPQKDGSLRFVAVEYVVPFDAWTESEPPKLYDVSFHRSEAFGLWVLHVWHFQENPNGLFTDWNPRVSRQYAIE